jgi:glycerol-3-phosphate cytidylyltransferase
MIGLICGCFDLFHVGHLNILEKAKSKCDKLIVGIVDDEYIQKHKNGSVIKQNDRKRIVQALKCVDETYIVSEDIINNRLSFCKEHNIDVVFDGDDWKGADKYKVLEENGISVVFFPYTKGISTSQLKNKIGK